MTGPYYNYQSAQAPQPPPLGPPAERIPAATLADFDYRRPDDRILREIKTIEKLIDRQHDRAAMHRSAIIDAELEVCKLTALSRQWQNKLGVTGNQP